MAKGSDLPLLVGPELGNLFSETIINLISAFSLANLEKAMNIR
jgi:hypothetical protein